MFGLAQVIARRDELLGAGNPAPLPAIPAAGKLATGGPSIGQSVIVIAPGNPIGIGDMGRGRLIGPLGRTDRLWPDHPIIDTGKPHLAAQPLQQISEKVEQYLGELEHKRRQELYGAAREDMQNTQRQPGQ